MLATFLCMATASAKTTTALISEHLAPLDSRVLLGDTEQFVGKKIEVMMLVRCRNTTNCRMVLWDLETTHPVALDVTHLKSVPRDELQKNCVSDVCALSAIGTLVGKTFVITNVEILDDEDDSDAVRAADNRVRILHPFLRTAPALSDPTRDRRTDTGRSVCPRSDQLLPVVS